MSSHRKGRPRGQQEDSEEPEGPTSLVRDEVEPCSECRHPRGLPFELGATSQNRGEYPPGIYWTCWGIKTLFLY